MAVIGLTGGIASGKTTAANYLRRLGAIVIDADRLGHRVYEPGSPGFEQVVNAFGHEIVGKDGQIDRRVLGGKVFGDPERMQQLTDITWPAIKRLAREEIADIKRRQPDAVIVLEAAVLLEAGWEDLVDEVWVVSVKPSVALQRLMERNGLSEEQAQSRIDSQMPQKERDARADVKIDNSDTVEKLEQRIDRQWKRLQKRIAEPAAKR